MFFFWIILNLLIHPDLILRKRSSQQAQDSPSQAHNFLAWFCDMSPHACMCVIYNIYIYICVCVCVWVYVAFFLSFFFSFFLSFYLDICIPKSSMKSMKVVSSWICPSNAWRLRIEHQSDQRWPQRQWTVDVIEHIWVDTLGHGFNLPSGYVNIAIENGHRNSGFSHIKWWIFPYVTNYQRVPLVVMFTLQ